MRSSSSPRGRRITRRRSPLSYCHRTSADRLAGQRITDTVRHSTRPLPSGHYVCVAAVTGARPLQTRTRRWKLLRGVARSRTSSRLVRGERRSLRSAATNFGGSHGGDPSVPGRRYRRDARRFAAAYRRDALADQGTRRRSVAGCAVGGDAGARPLLDDRLRLAPVRGATERAAAVQDRDRRAEHPLHPREVGTRERVAVDHDARLAGLDRRATRDHRPTHRPNRARRKR